MVMWGCDSAKNDGGEEVEINKALLAAKMVRYKGFIVAGQQESIVAQVSGEIDFFPAEVGDFVKSKRLLVAFDPATYRERYKVLKTESDSALSIYQKKMKLHQKVDTLEDEVLKARVSYERALAAAEQAFSEISHTRIIAPFDGYVSRKLMEAGDEVHLGDVLMEFVNIDIVDALIPVSSQMAEILTPGDIAFVKVGELSSEIYRGVLEEVIMRSEENSARISIVNQARLIMPGMSCTVVFPADFF